MRSLLWILVVGALLVAGCGGDDDAQAETDATPVASEEPKAEETPDPKADIRKLATGWLQATAARDAKAACELLAPSERRHFTKQAGSCPAAFTPALTPKAARIAKTSDVGLITVYKNDGYATIAVEDPKLGEYMKLYAIDEDGRWWLAREAATKG